jgi:4-amino-4-deoxychorismate lyase
LSILLFNDNSPVEHLSPLDRGLAYGDGVFETILAVNGELIWWSEHWQRLISGAQRLGITSPSEQLIYQAALQLAGVKRCVIKVILTRGVGGRGYAPTAGSVSTIVSMHPAPEILKSPVKIRWCQTPISQQPALAGLKHLNRLENVVARSEWQDEVFFEGLMSDLSDNVICATSANLFIYSKQRWLTPSLNLSGICGLTRQWLLDNIGNISVEPICHSDVENADAIFLCNSVRGMMEVSHLESLALPKTSFFNEINMKFLNRNPAFLTE